MFVTGTCATYTQTLNGNSATFTSSKGNCEITSAGVFSCASGNVLTTFTTVRIPFQHNPLYHDQKLIGLLPHQTSDGVLSNAGSDVFSADSVPANSNKIPVYTGSAHTIPLTLLFTAGANTVTSVTSKTATAVSLVFAQCSPNVRLQLTFSLSSLP